MFLQFNRCQGQRTPFSTRFLNLGGDFGEFGSDALFKEDGDGHAVKEPVAFPGKVDLLAVSGVGNLDGPEGLWNKVHDAPPTVDDEAECRELT